MYERLFALIDRNSDSGQVIPRTGFSNLEIQNQALTSLRQAFDDESSEDNRAISMQSYGEESEEFAEQHPADRAPLTDRFEWILANIERRLDIQPELLEHFCSCFTPSEYNQQETEQIRDWLERIAADGNSYSTPANSLLALRILYGGYGATWAEAGERLMAELDHEDLTIRACAAYQIGTFCHRLAPEDGIEDWLRGYAADREATEGMDPLASYWELIRNKEIERAGVAGAFWYAAPKWTVDADEWILALVLQSGDEPYIRYFPCDIGFDAHERYSRNPAAIRRMMDAGRLGLALAAAAEEPEPVDGMEPLLIELGASDDPYMVHSASWALAYRYNFLHPEGQRLGFVQRHTQFADYDLFLLFSAELLAHKQPDVPYAVVLYPKAPQRYWTRKKAKALVDRVFPSTARGVVRNDDFSDSMDSEQVWYQRGYVRFSPAGKREGARGVSRITIGYRSDVYWNPTK